MGRLLIGERREQGVVGTQGVGRDAELAHARIIGQDDVDRRRQSPSPAALVEDVRDGDGAEGAPREGLAEGGIERAGAHLVEEPE
jgi:hypothetical protein